MQQGFDPYLKWLGVRDPERPPDHYRLLGIERFEDDPEVIAHAADRQMAHLRTFQTGRHAELSQQVLNELAAARVCLLNPARKAAYDAELHGKLAGRGSELPLDETAADLVPAAGDARRDDARPPTAVRPWRRLAAAAGVAMILIGAFVVWRRQPTGPVAQNPQPPVDQRPIAEPRAPKQTVAPAPDDEGTQHADAIPDPAAAVGATPEAVEPPSVADESVPTIAPAPTEPTEAVPVRPVEAAPATIARMSVPDQQRLAAANAAVEDRFGEAIAAATDGRGRLAVAERLTSAADETQSSAECYALLDHAIDLATTAADYESACRIADAMSERFQVDVLPRKADALDRWFAAGGDPADTVRHARRLSDEAIAKDNYALARRSAALALRCARRLSDNAAIEELRDVQTRVRLLERHFDRIVDDLAELARNDDDADANLAVGEFYCLVKRDWNRGLVYLVNGGNEELQAAAAADLAAGDDPRAQRTAADAWWQLATGASGTDRAALQARAEVWYRRALPRIEGPARDEVQARLDQFAHGGARRPVRTLPEVIELSLATDTAIVLRWIPAGRFLMGPPDAAHEVDVAEPFYLSVTEITQGQWLAVMNNNPSYYAERRDLNLPVDNVSYRDCQQFIAALEQSRWGRNYDFRLPTEAEWEYAARAGETEPYHFGGDDATLARHAWFHPANAERKTHPVAQRSPNAWGLHDMYGNLWEWCSADPALRPADGSDPAEQVLRGGSYLDRAEMCTSTARRLAPSDERLVRYGLRLVCQP